MQNLLYIVCFSPHLKKNIVREVNSTQVDQVILAYVSSQRYKGCVVFSQSDSLSCEKTRFLSDVHCIESYILKVNIIILRFSTDTGLNLFKSCSH